MGRKKTQIIYWPGPKIKVFQLAYWPKTKVLWSCFNDGIFLLWSDSSLILTPPTRCFATFSSSSLWFTSRVWFSGFLLNSHMKWTPPGFSCKTHVSRWTRVHSHLNKPSRLCLKWTKQLQRDSVLTWFWSWNSTGNIFSLLKLQLHVFPVWGYVIISFYSRPLKGEEQDRSGEKQTILYFGL